jgi:hypothetical protein
LVYRAWDAVLRLRKEGIDVGLVNKPTVNVIDEEVLQKIGKTGFVLVAESQNQRTGVSDLKSELSFLPLAHVIFSIQLGIRYGTWLLERGLTPKYAYIGAVKEGCGGLTEQIPWQGLDPKCTSPKLSEQSRMLLSNSSRLVSQRSSTRLNPSLKDVIEKCRNKNGERNGLRCNKYCRCICSERKTCAHINIFLPSCIIFLTSDARPRRK